MVVWILLAILLCQIEAYKHRPHCENIAEYSVKGAAASSQCPTCDEYHPSSKNSVLTTVPRGQLGNHLHSYALLSSLQAHLPSLTFSISSETQSYLTTYFSPLHLLLSSVDSLCLCKSHRGVYSKPWAWRTWNTPRGRDFVEVLIYNMNSKYLDGTCTVCD